jgi:hypothetical protein
LLVSHGGKGNNYVKLFSDTKGIDTSKSLNIDLIIAISKSANSTVLPIPASRLFQFFKIINLFVLGGFPAPHPNSFPTSFCM